MASFFGGLDVEAYDRVYSDRQLLARIADYFRPQGRRLLIITVLVLLTGAAGAGVPFVLARGISGLAGALTPGLMTLLVGFVFSANLLSYLANYTRRRLTARVIGDVVLALQRDAFRAAAEHDLSFYDEFSSGRIVSRITGDTRGFADTITLTTDLLSQLAQLAIVAAVLVSISWPLTLLVAAMTPVIFAVAIGFRRAARRVTRHGSRAMANVNAMIQESVAGIAVAKNFRQEGTIFSQFGEVNRLSYTVNVRRGFVFSIIFPILNALGGVGSATVVYFGGRAALQAAIGVGAWYLFIQSIDFFWFPIMNISAFWSQFQAGLSSAERVFALIDAESQVIQSAHQPAPRLRDAISFERLHFRYTRASAGSEAAVDDSLSPEERARRAAVLDDFSLAVRAGETVALVGHTGAGKSSIAKLIARFYEFQGGALRIDGRDIRTFDLRDYRRQLGIVSQVPFLFAGTVADNIRYSRPEAAEAEIEAMAMRIGGGEWVETLPEGLQTHVGERGARLSMGQRQLVSLMRVLIQRPAIFILDEATASIDPFTESQIQEALDLILANSTSILIAHRLSTIRAADRIIVLKQGQIIEEGSHASLLADGGHYAELYNTYFRHQSLAYVERARELV